MKPKPLHKRRISQIVFVLTTEGQMSPEEVKRKVGGMFLTKRDKGAVERLYNSAVAASKKRAGESVMASSVAAKKREKKNPKTKNKR